MRDELTDSPPWQPSASAEAYTNSSARNSDYYDSDISGAPIHSAGGSGTGGKVVYTACGSPASHDRRVQSIGSISYTCYYQAVIPGVHKPDTDSFLGCDVAVSTDSTSGQLNVIGAHKGAPVDGGSCSGSPMSVGDTISISSSPDTSVADINALWNGNKVEGWMYLGDDKTRFIQLNYQNQAGQNGAVSIGIASGGVSSPGGYSGIYKWNGRLPPGTRVKKCFTRGSQLA
jgi:hypothetical protein